MTRIRTIIPILPPLSSGIDTPLSFSVINQQPYLSLSSLSKITKVNPVSLLKYIQDNKLPHCRQRYTEKLRADTIWLPYSAAIDLTFKYYGECDALRMNKVNRIISSNSYRTKVYKMCRLPLPQEWTWLKPTTTAGGFICCGASSFKPIKKARFE